MPPRIYLDHAAATPLDEAVLAAMQPYFSQQFFNPSATYLAAKQVRQDVEAARAKVAERLGARPVEITFTAGGTEANNLAIHGLMQAHAGKKIIVSSIEHESVRETARQYRCIEAPVKTDGLLDVAALEKLIDDEVVLISVMYANNEIGTIQPLREVARLVHNVQTQRRRRAIKLPLYVHTDAAQAANYLDLHVSRLGVDLMTLNGSKIYGPKQSGALWVRTGIELKPVMYGGGQEHNLRSGTENIPGIIGFSRALEITQTLRHQEGVRLQKLQQLFFDELAEKIPAASINGSLKRRLPNNIHLTLPGQDNERLLIQLDERGILAAAGSACSADSGEPSHVLKAMGISRADAQSSLRFTMGRSTTEGAVRSTANMLAQLIS